MKVYVIKNKDGKYYNGNYIEGGQWDNDFSWAYLYTYKGDAEHEIEASWEKDKFDNCEVVEVTLAEGDLEKELAIYKKAVEKIKEHFNYDVKNNFIVSPNCVNYINMYIPDVENFLDNVLDQARKELEEK